MKRLVKPNELEIRIELHFEYCEANDLVAAAQDILANLRRPLTAVQRNAYNNFIEELRVKLEISDVAYTPPMIEEEPSDEPESVTTYLKFFLTGHNSGRISNPVIRLRVSDHLDTSDKQKRATDTDNRGRQYARNAKAEGHILHIPKGLKGLLRNVIIKQWHFLTNAI